MRKLGIPTVVDRVIQQAICKVKEYTEQGYTHAVEVDLSKYFDTLNHELLMNLLHKQIQDKRVTYLLESCRKLLECKLKLTTNAQKNFKFLGFCLEKNGKGVFIRAHRKSIDKAKRKLKELTKRNQGRNVRLVMQNVEVFIRGWIGYFYVADMRRILQGWNEWLRRRFRMYI